MSFVEPAAVPVDWHMSFVELSAVPDDGQTPSSSLQHSLLPLILSAERSVSSLNSIFSGSSATKITVPSHASRLMLSCPFSILNCFFPNTGSNKSTTFVLLTGSLTLKFAGASSLLATTNTAELSNTLANANCLFVSKSCSYLP